MLRSSLYTSVQTGIWNGQGCNTINKFLNARLHDPIFRIRFLVPEIGNRRSDGPILRFCFCGENVGRSFVVCPHHPIMRFENWKQAFRGSDFKVYVHMIRFSELTMNLQFGTKTITGISCKIRRRLSSFKCGEMDENRAFSISIRLFSKLPIRVYGGHFQCLHTIRFSEPTKSDPQQRIV